MDWTTILTTLGSTAIVVAVLGWITRSVILQWMARNLETHKRDLKSAGERELEHLRLTLRLEEARQSRLLDRQARVIAGVFARLERLHEAMAKLASPVQAADANMGNLRADAIAAFNLFGAYYYERAIWLDADTCDAINDLQGQFHRLLFDLSFRVDERGYPADLDAWHAAYTRLKNELPTARKLLDKRFRALLGVIDEKSGPATIGTKA